MSRGTWIASAFAVYLQLLTFSCNTHSALAVCDESDPAQRFEPAAMDPFIAQQHYGAANKLFPTRKILGTCGDVGSWPTSIARPALFSTPMFTTKAGVEANNNAAGDLPVVKTYEDQVRTVDVFEALDLNTVIGNFFLGKNTANSPTGTFDQCRPAGYTGTELMAYGSATNGFTVPGPTIKNCAGRQTLVRFCNKLPTKFGPNRAFSVHLHGSASVAAYDGWAEDITDLGECKEYLYPNNRATGLWYHDHTLDFTADNTFAGMAGQYIVRDCTNDKEKNYMPKDKHTIPFVMKDFILAKTLNAAGQAPLNYDKAGAHQDFVFGDINTVNGKPWPYLKVEPRVYRLNVLNAAASREWSLKFIAESEAVVNGVTVIKQAWVDFYLIGTDGGQVLNARKLNHIFVANAERADILISFKAAHLPTTTTPWKYVYAVNDYGSSTPSTAAPHFCKTHLLARFELSLPLDTATVSAADTTWPPTGFFNTRRALRSLISNAELDAYKARAMSGGMPDRDFAFGKGMNGWVINGFTWADPTHRIIANPPRDGIELWRLKGGGGWHHPIHIHLVDFLVVYAVGRSTDQYNDFDILTQNTNGAFSNLNPLRCSVTADCPSGSTCTANTCTRSSCSLDSHCPLGTYCVANACTANGLRRWEQDAPKDVVFLGDGDEIWVMARFGPYEADYMFHCHNVVHEDHAMMLAFGVGRTVEAGALPGDNQFSVKAGVVKQAPNAWTPQPYRSQPSAKPVTPGVAFDGLSPQASTKRNGVMNENVRNPETNLSFLVTSANTVNLAADLPAHFCPYFYDGIYDNFYPSSKTALTAQLALRPGTQTGNIVNGVTKYPSFDVVGNINYNPIQQNLYCVDYTKPEITTPSGHSDYEEHRYQYATSSHGHDGAMSPAAIVYPQYPNADADVKLAIQWAADRGVAIAVRTGGHQYCGVSSTGGANIQLDMSRAYTEFEYDAATGLLRTGISHKLIDFRAKLAERGLFVAHGQCSHVRIGGHAQTGGYGQLSRAFGLFGDHIVAIRIITADQEVRELTRDSAVAADQELFWAVLGGSPGNFGVLTHVTIRPHHDEDHPNAHGMKFYALYKKEKVQKLLQIMAEMAADDEFPGDYDYCVTVVSAGQSILPAYDFRDIDAYMRTRHPGTYGDNDKMGWPAAIVVYVQWANLGGASQTFDDAWFNKIKSAASEGIIKPIFELKADKPTKMSQMTDFWVFKNVREFEMPYKKRTYATNSTDLAATGWAAATAQRIEDLERDFANGCNAMVQIQHYGGRHSAFARGDAARRTSYSFRDTSVIAVMDCFYEDARGAHAFVHRLLGKSPAQVADKWQRGNDAAFKGPRGTFSRGFDRRVLWGSYISDASESNMGATWPLYHEDSDKYDRLCTVKRRVDPHGVFTPNAFCVGVPAPAPTHA